MEYIIFLTYGCNLRCSYCFASNVVFDRKSSHCCISKEQAIKTIEFIRKDITKRASTENSIVFFGGEPTLVPEIIDFFLQNTKDLNLRYSIYTNGLLLNQIAPNILNSFDSILVAIDGDKTAHEKYKPVGSYDKILNNVDIIRKKFNGEIIARITMEEDTNIYKSVVNLIDKFDFIHWQIVNKNSFNNPNEFIQKYRNNISMLCDYWLDGLNKGRVYNIIPINEIMMRLLTGEWTNQQKSFLCGCGQNVMSIDISGNVYLCDEYINEPDKSIGVIGNNNIDLKCPSHTDLFDDCKNCSVSSICCGRCRKSLESLELDSLRVYCEMTHILINELSSKVNEVKNILIRNNLKNSFFVHSKYNTEIIP